MNTNKTKTPNSENGDEINTLKHFAQKRWLQSATTANYLTENSGAIIVNKTHNMQTLLEQNKNAMR
jgi:hypothetical protein